MNEDWAFAQFGEGVLVRSFRDGSVIALEFNAFLKAIAAYRIDPQDEVLSRVYTDGRMVAAGSLRFFHEVLSGQIRTDDLPIRSPGGVLATGYEAMRAWTELVDQE